MPILTECCSILSKQGGVLPARGIAFRLCGHLSSHARQIEITAMDLLQTLEAASCVVTIVGLPLAIGVFIYEQRRERANEEEDIFLKLSDDYSRFMQLVLQNADLQLRSAVAKSDLSDEQRERKLILFALLVSLFERAFVLVYEDNMSRQQRRLWGTWADYMREWCRREDFRAALPGLMNGEDPDFARTIERIAEEERRVTEQAGSP